MVAIYATHSKGAAGSSLATTKKKAVTNDGLYENNAFMATNVFYPAPISSGGVSGFITTTCVGSGGDGGDLIQPRSIIAS